MNTWNSTGCFCDSTGCFYQQWIKTTKTDIKEFRERKNQTNNFILVHFYTKSYIQFPETYGYPLSNQIPDYKRTTTKRSDLDPLKHTHFLWNTTITPQIRTSSDSVNTSTHRIKNEERNRIDHTWYKSNQSTQQVLLHSYRNIQSLKQSWRKLDFTNWSCKFNDRSVKQNIYTPISSLKHLL